MNRCAHSLLACGDCRAEMKEAELARLAARTLEDLGNEVEAYRAKLLDEYWNARGITRTVDRGE